MKAKPEPKAIQCIAFEGDRCIAFGELPEVAIKVKEAFDRGAWTPIVVFDAVTSEVVELDLRGSEEDVLRRLPSTKEGTEGPRKPGRPKLGVASKEVTLLPRHWEWLSRQPGGASATLRKLVEVARKGSGDKDRIRAGQESAYRFLAAMAGNLPNFEEATRALFAAKPEPFTALIADWPDGIRQHAQRLANAAM